MSDPVARLNAALEGRYAIERELGEGGMATVYLADDLKHQRKVALKVLKPELAAVVGAERFLAEITTTASLTHPHILPLFDSGEADGFLFYVMPHIEGESLRERIDREKQLPVDEAVKIATDLAEALDYAHRHKIIHRDIKPANILIHEGRPLIADFGIALAVGVAGGGRLTETGLSVGTPHYMSPEQATGDQAVGVATDIYALGAVLYEMLIGDPPYTGSTAQAILGKIIQGKLASATEERASVPANVDAAIRKALEKLPADRFTGAQEFAKALGDPGFRHGEESAVALPTHARGWRPLALTALGAAALASGVTTLLTDRPERPSAVARFELTMPDGLERNYGLAISPDGRRIVFRGVLPSGERQLHVRDLDQLSASPLSGTEGAGNYAVFSPDGESVAFVAGNALRTVTLNGGALTLVSDSVANAGGGVDWSLDGFIYFRRSGQGIWRVPEAGGAIERVSVVRPDESGHEWFDVLPNGEGIVFSSFLFSTSTVAVSIISLEDGEVRTLMEGHMWPRYSRSGHILTATTDGTLWATPFDAERLQTTGQSRPVLEGLWVGINGNPEFVVGESGTFIYREGFIGVAEGAVVWLGRDGSEELLNSELVGSIEAVAISPDGERVAYDHTIADRTDVWVYSLADRTSSRLTFEGDYNARPSWSPNGRDVGFISTRGDTRQALYARPWDGSGPPRLIRAPVEQTILWEGDWAPDGRTIVYRQLPRSGVGHLFRTTPYPDSVPVPILQNDFFNVAVSFSPNGRWLAYQSNETGRDEIWVRPFPGPGGARLVSTDGGISPIWSHSGREIFYVSADEFFVVATVQTEPEFRVESREQLVSAEAFATSRLIQQYDVAPDDQRLLVIRSVEDAASRDIVVLNFFEEIRERVPVN